MNEQLEKTLLDFGTDLIQKVQSGLDMGDRELTSGAMYWVSDISEDKAIRNKTEQEFVVAVNGRMYFKEIGDKEYLIPWEYAVPVEQPAEYFIVKKQGGEVTETKLTDKQREELGL